MKDLSCTGLHEAWINYTDFTIAFLLDHGYLWLRCKILQVTDAVCESVVLGDADWLRRFLDLSVHLL